MRVAFGTDETSELTELLLRLLREGGHDVVVSRVDRPWPERGVVCCWTGTGVSIAANKVPGVRAALCTDAATAAGARRWNDANVLAVSLRLTSPAVARELLDAFFSTAPDPGEAANIAQLP